VWFQSVVQRAPNKTKTGISFDIAYLLALASIESRFVLGIGFTVDEKDAGADGCSRFGLEQTRGGIVAVGILGLGAVGSDEADAVLNACLLW
jgi:hypothetical protein